jgi:predicted ATPase with chaperone activity
MGDWLTLAQPEKPPQDAHLPAPRTPQDTGLSMDLLTQLVLKTLYFAGELTGAELARRLGVMFSVIEPVLEGVKLRRHVELVGGAVVGGSSYRYRMTGEGRSLTALFLEQNQYVGVAPVPIAQYNRYMEAVARDEPAHVTREQVRDACAHLVVGERIIDELGPAINGGHSLFIYGPPGNGKTVLARVIGDLLAGQIGIPHALEVEGEVIRVFDPVSHVEQQIPRDEGLALDVDLDRRWAICRRPVVATGGELNLTSLDLTFDGRLGYYRAPIHLLANGGLLILDDFGRQRCAPHDLLNRWMVPLESRVDYLTLQSGLKFEVPFDVFITFATNLAPAALVDEAFLRRVKYKVFADDPTPAEYIRIFDQVCRERGLPPSSGLAQGLLDGFYHERALPLRACQPRDLIDQALLLASYRGEPRALTLELLETACAAYFVHDSR